MAVPPLQAPSRARAPSSCVRDLRESTGYKIRKNMDCKIHEEKCYQVYQCHRCSCLAFSDDRKFNVPSVTLRYATMLPFACEVRCVVAWPFLTTHKSRVQAHNSRQRRRHAPSPPQPPITTTAFKWSNQKFEISILLDSPPSYHISYLHLCA